MLDDLLGGVCRADGGRVDTNIGRLGRFVGAVDAGEIFALAAARFLVEPLHIARPGDLDRRIDEDFTELAARDHRAHPFTLQTNRPDHNGTPDHTTPDPTLGYIAASTTFSNTL